jgi:solute carrier family 25, member 33/36
MYKKEGFRSLYRGVVMNTIAGSIANSIFFFVYQDGKKRYKFDKDKPYDLQTILISYRAGLCSTIITTPMWTVKTRMVLFQEY